jgi:protein phosphatase
MTIRFNPGSATHVGQVRSANQDTLLAQDDLYAVADGMGGHNGGEVASQLAIESMRADYAVPTTDALVDAIQAANEAVMARAEEDPSLRGMGTTMVALASVVTDGEERIAVVNVGDSRCYLLEGDHLRQITKDHSVVQTLVDNGQITAAEAETHPQRNILTRALGIDTRVMADSWELLPFIGDRYLLCSDGLFNEVSEAEMADVLRARTDPNDAAQELVRMANAGGGRDNITVVIVDVVDDGGRRADADAAASRVAAHTTGVRRAVANGSDPPTGSGEVGTTASGSEGGGGAESTPDARRGLSFRTVAFVCALIAIALTVAASVIFATRNSYYVGIDSEQVVIFQGQPGGFLGIEPSVKERTNIAVDQIPPAYVDEIEQGEEFSSLDDARSYVARLEEDVASSDDGPVRRIDPAPDSSDDDDRPTETIGGDSPAGTDTDTTTAE